MIVAVAGIARWAVPGLSGSTATWSLIGALWLTGAVAAGWCSRSDRQAGMVARLGVQNVAIQLLVALPGVIVGIWRMLRATEGGAGLAYLANAVVTAIALPAFSAVVLTLAGLLLAVPVARLAGPSTGTGER